MANPTPRELGNVIPVIVFGVAHVIEISEPMRGGYLVSWDGNPIQYDSLTHSSKLDALVCAVAKIAEQHLVAQNHWKTPGI